VLRARKGLRTLLFGGRVANGTKDSPGLIGDVAAGWTDHNGIQMAGALAFFGALSAAPLIVVAVVAAGILLGREVASGQVVAQLTPVIGEGAAKALQSAAMIALSPKQGLIAAIVAIVGTLFGAAGVVIQMRTSLDMVLGREDLGAIRSAIADWGSAITAVFTIGVAAVLALTAWSVATSLAVVAGGAPGTLAVGVTTSVVFFALLTLGYRLLPSRRPPWRSGAVGAGIATVAAILATAAMSLYLRTGFAASVYGAAASFFVFLMWLWFVGIGFVVGAECVRVLSRDEADDGARPSAQTAEPRVGNPPTA
jgi:membrane protein